MDFCPKSLCDERSYARHACGKASVGKEGRTGVNSFKNLFVKACESVSFL